MPRFLPDARATVRNLTTADNAEKTASARPRTAHARAVSAAIGVAWASTTTAARDLASYARDPRRLGRPSGSVIRFGVLVVLVAGLASATLIVGPNRQALLSAAGTSPLMAPMAAVVGSALLVAAFVPRTLLALVGGALFGALTGTAYVLAGVTTGAALAYLLGRLLGRSFVSARLRGRLAMIEAAVARRGAWAVIVCRMIPIVPFAISNYAFGTSSVRPRHFLAGTMLGSVPSTIAYASLGSATMQGDWLAAQVAGVCAAGLSVLGVIGTYLVWQRRPRRTSAASQAA